MTAILANGEFPREGGEAWRLLASAERVVACDGAADKYRRHFGREPDVVVGDLDSLSSPPLDPSRVMHIPDQNDNDLQKAISLCRARGWWPPVILGATGLREDHTIGNIFRALETGLEMVSDCGRFVPVEGCATFQSRKGAAVSVFAPDPETRVSSIGLEWPLDGVRFENLYCATLNRTTGPSVTIKADRRIFVYFAFA